MLEWIPAIIIIAIVGIFLLKGFVVVRPTHVGAKETFGKYKGFKKSGLNYIIPFVQRLVTVNITEQLVDVKRQDVITKENLNCMVDAQVYYKVGKTEEDLKKAIYNVHNVQEQIVQLAKSTLRDVIGKKMFKEVNSARDELNGLIMKELKEETKSWGIEILRVELKEIIPPEHVQSTMDKIIMAENEKDAEKDLANALVVKTKGEKEKMILDAQADKRRVVLEAEAKQESQIKIATGEAKAITLVASAKAEKYKVEGKSLQEHFVKTAIDFKTLETIENAYANNSKIIVTDPKTPLTLLVDDTYQKKLKFPYKSTESKD
jgi:regulator of protease activity HflC (stomatin/prohibitin superfamily)